MCSTACSEKFFQQVTFFSHFKVCTVATFLHSTQIALSQGWNPLHTRPRPAPGNIARHVLLFLPQNPSRRHRHARNAGPCCAFPSIFAISIPRQYFIPCDRTSPASLRSGNSFPESLEMTLFSHTVYFHPLCCNDSS